MKTGMISVIREQLNVETEGTFERTIDNSLNMLRARVAETRLALESGDTRKAKDILNSLLNETD